MTNEDAVYILQRICGVRLPDYAVKHMQNIDPKATGTQMVQDAIDLAINALKGHRNDEFNSLNALKVLKAMKEVDIPKKDA